MKRRLALILLLAAPLLSAERRAKNVILFLGDAGGIATVHAASVHRYGQPGRLFVQRMAHIGLSEASSASDWVSDSAAGMTAIVTGRKTHNGVISQSDTAVPGVKDGEPLKTILEYAEERGLSTGVVSNSSMVSATPAACYAHVNARARIGEIFAQVLTPRFGDGVDVIIGPGRKSILEATGKLGLDLLSELPKRGYSLADSVEAILPDRRRVVTLLDTAEFDLDAATQRAIHALSHNPKGFFLMVESDVHANRLPRGLERMADFDRIIERTAERLAGSATLILFTADHSFDLRVIRSAPKSQPLVSGAPPAQPPRGLIAGSSHSAEEVLVSAQGPGAGRVRGFLSNTDVFHIMMMAYGWERPSRR